MNIFLGVLIGIFVMTVVVTVHEFGHFIVAKRNGVNVKEFGIGFPPKAKTWLHIPTEKAKEYCKKFDFSEAKTEKILAKAKKKGKNKYIWIPLPKDEWYEETEDGLMPKTQDYLIFSINCLPIGGFCQMDGETNIDTRKGTFGAASLWSKTKILFAGVTMNWIFAILVLTGLALTSGIPRAFEDQFYIENDTEVIFTERAVVVDEVFKDTPAEKAGLLADDTLISASYEGETKTLETTADINEFNTNHKNQTVVYHIIRGQEKDKEGEEKDIEITLGDESMKYILGISMAQYGIESYRSTWSAPIVAVVNTVQITGQTFRGLGELVVKVFSGITSQFSGNEATKEEGKQNLESAGNSVAGPIGIIGTMFPRAAEQGIAVVLFLAAIISISLACMNVLPIPALDGGRWFLIILFEKILHRKLTPEIESKIVSRAFIGLLILAGLITILDVMKIMR